jgi:hypothetical protein
MVAAFGSAFGCHGVLSIRTSPVLLVCYVSPLLGSLTIFVQLFSVHASRQARPVKISKIPRLIFFFKPN